MNQVNTMHSFLCGSSDNLVAVVFFKPFHLEIRRDRQQPCSGIPPVRQVPEQGDVESEG